MEERAWGGVGGWEPMECWCWDGLRDSLAVQRKKTAPRGPMAAEDHLEAEEVEGTAGQ